MVKSSKGHEIKKRKRQREKGKEKGPKEKDAECVLDVFTFWT